MSSVLPQSAATKRGLILHDSLAFLALLVISLTLFGMTSFLFTSFEQHRLQLAARWSNQGESALAAGHPEEAVAALRTALSYTPDGDPGRNGKQLLLAQALAGSGHVEEAASYFENLWDAHPGDGFINLQLARLARRHHDDARAAEYYRAAIFGSWQGDGVLRRREVRLELIDFLLAQHRFEEARSELLIVAGNNPDEHGIDVALAEKLAAAGDSADAWIFFRRAEADASPADPHASRRKPE